MAVYDITTGQQMPIEDPDDRAVHTYDAALAIARDLGIDGMQREWHLSLDMATRFFNASGGTHLRAVS